MPGFGKTKPFSNKQRLLWRRLSDFVLSVRGTLVPAAAARPDHLSVVWRPLEEVAHSSISRSAHFRQEQRLRTLLDKNGPERALLFRMRVPDIGPGASAVRNGLQPK